jgi:hypothetical protein
VNQALDDIRSAEAWRMKWDGYEPVLTKSRWRLLKRPANLTAHQKVKLKDLVRYNLQSVRAYLLKEDFQQLWNYNSTAWADKFLDHWCRQVMRSRIEPMKKVARTLRAHRELILNYFRARKEFSSGVIEGLNNKAKVTMRKSYGFRTFRVTELALYHSLWQTTRAGTHPQILLTNQNILSSPATASANVQFPRSQFRSALSESLPNEGLGLCGRRDAAPPHTKVAYLWATRVPNVGPPRISIEQVNSLPATLKSALPVGVLDMDWRVVRRARNWTLPADGGQPIPIQARKLSESKMLELDLGHTVKPGKYTLAANWDWDRFQAKGQIEVKALGDFASARLGSSAQDLLVAKTGKTPVTLEGGDFEFVTQVDGKPHAVPVKILSAPPSIENFQVALNQGASSAEFRLKGQRLDLLKRIEVAKGTAELGPASPRQTERKLILRMAADIDAGTSLARTCNL